MLPADLVSLCYFHAFVVVACQVAAFVDEICYDINRAADKVQTNSIQHGYGPSSRPFSLCTGKNVPDRGMTIAGSDYPGLTNGARRRRQPEHREADLALVGFSMIQYTPNNDDKKKIREPQPSFGLE